MGLQDPKKWWEREGSCYSSSRENRYQIQFKNIKARWITKRKLSSVKGLKQVMQSSSEVKM